MRMKYGCAHTARSLTHTLFDRWWICLILCVLDRWSHKRHQIHKLLEQFEIERFDFHPKYFISRCFILDDILIKVLEQILTM